MSRNRFFISAIFISAAIYICIVTFFNNDFHSFDSDDRQQRETVGVESVRINDISEEESDLRTTPIRPTIPPAEEITPQPILTGAVRDRDTGEPITYYELEVKKCLPDETEKSVLSKNVYSDEGRFSVKLDYGPVYNLYIYCSGFNFSSPFHEN